MLATLTHPVGFLSFLACVAALVALAVLTSQVSPGSPEKEPFTTARRQWLAPVQVDLWRFEIMQGGRNRLMHKLLALCSREYDARFTGAISKIRQTERKGTS